MSLLGILFISQLAYGKLSGEVCADKLSQGNTGDFLRIVDSVLGPLSRVLDPAPLKVAARFGRETRVFAPLTRTGLLVNEYSGRCTVGYVTRCHFVSAAHCAVKDNLALDPSDLHIIPSNHIGALSEGSRIEVETLSSVEPFLQQKVERNDTIFGKMKSNQGSVGGTFGIGLVNENLEVQPLSRPHNGVATNKFCRPKPIVSGHNWDLKIGAELHPRITSDTDVELVKLDEDGVLYSKADSSGGASGGPIWICVRGSPILIGIISTAFINKDDKMKNPTVSQESNDLEFMAKGPSANVFVDSLREFIEKNPCD